MLLGMSMLTTGCASAAPAPAGTPVAPSRSVPSFGHVYLLVLENRDFTSIVGSPSAPYLNSLMSEYGLATNYHAVAHPSEPNYFAIVSGSTQGVIDDGVHDLRAPNLADQLESAGRSWAVFAQNVPAGCFTGAESEGGRDGPGTYVRKHEPFISFKSISTDAARCARIQDLSAFDPAVADFELIVPNQQTNMHDGTIQESDDFLRAFVPRILTSASWREGGVLFIVWDESRDHSVPGGHVPLIVVSSGTVAGFRSAAPHDHYSLLRTIEDGLGLACLGAACSRTDNLAEFFPLTPLPTGAASPQAGLGTDVVSSAGSVWGEGSAPAR